MYISLIGIAYLHWQLDALAFARCAPWKRRSAAVGSCRGQYVAELPTPTQASSASPVWCGPSRARRAGTHWLFSAQPPSAPTPWTAGESPETSCGPCGRSRASPEATDSCRSPAVLRGLPTPLSRPSSVTCELASLVDQRQRQVEWRLSPQHQDQQVEQVKEESAPSVEAGGSPLQHLPLRWSWGLSGDFWTLSLLSPWMERSSLGEDVWDPSR